MSILYASAYLMFLVCDVYYLVKWMGYGEEECIALFVLLMIFHLVFPILAFVFHRKASYKKTAVILLPILCIIAAYSVLTAHTMTKYVYKSRNGTYDKTIDDFKGKASMTVTSESLEDGRWTDDISNTSKGSNLSPQISFEPVEGASYYVIYMVDESAHQWVHWYAEVNGTDLSLGENPGDYIGPYPPAFSGDHLYTVYVYALADKPGAFFDGEYPVFDAPWFAGDYLWTYLNIKDGKASPVLYGNVIAYGYISGTYSAD